MKETNSKVHLINNLKSEDFQACYNEYIELSGFRRGQFIDLTVEMEMGFDKYISNFFCGAQEMQHKIITGVFKNYIGLRAKKEIFVSIVKIADSDLIKNFVNFEARLHAIIKTRNIFAHWDLDYQKVPLYAKKKHTAFVNYDNPKQPTIISKSRYDDLVADLIELNLLIDNFGKFSNEDSKWLRQAMKRKT